MSFDNFDAAAYSLTKVREHHREFLARLSAHSVRFSGPSRLTVEDESIRANVLGIELRVTSTPVFEGGRCHYTRYVFGIESDRKAKPVLALGLLGKNLFDIEAPNQDDARICTVASRSLGHTLLGVLADRLSLELLRVDEVSRPARSSGGGVPYSGA